MVLTVSQCKLLIDMFNASLAQAVKSGIPVGKEYYDDIDAIRYQLYCEMADATKREETENGFNS